MWWLTVWKDVWDFLYENGFGSLKEMAEEANNYVEKKLDERFKTIEDFYYAYFRADPELKEYSDDAIREMAKGEAKNLIEHHKVLAVILTGIIQALDLWSPILGYLIGIANADSRRGEQLANYLRPAEIPDINTLTQAFILGKLDEKRLYDIARRHGFDEEMTRIFVNSMKKYLDFTQVRDAYYKGLITKDKAKEYLRKLGVDEEVLDMVLEIDRPLLNPSDIRDLFLRGEIDETEHDEMMKKFGYTEEQIDLIKRLYFYIPSIPDLIRLAVREAFSPETIEKFRMYEDYPEEFEQWAVKQGLSPEWAKRYWYAHWELPSLTQGYEMLHRGIIDENELKMLMKAQDVMPFWRDKLIQLSYNPYTRVDVRRMYQEGVLTEEEVKRAYMDLGYDEEKAEKLTEWTVKEATVEQRELTKSLVEDLFKRGLIQEDEAIEYLKDLGYREEIANLIIAKAKYDRERTVKNRIIAAIRKQYLKGLIDENEAIDKLNRAGFLTDEIDLLLYDWQLEKEAMQRNLTSGELKTLAKKGVIDKNTFIQEMRKLGYRDQHAEWIYESLFK